MIGKVVGTPEVDRVRNGTINALLMQVQFADSSDVRTVQYMPQSGDDVIPQKGSIVEVIQDGGQLIAIASYDKIESVGTPGDREIYSSTAAGGTKRARVICHTSGAVGIRNELQGISLLEALEALTTALSTFASAASASTTDSVLASAASALVTSITIAKAKLEQVLSKS